MSGEIRAIKLHFLTPLHLGRSQGDLDKSELLYHSDSLKSAIFAIGVQMYPEWQDADNFFHAFSVSSCFPYAGSELFLPKPLGVRDIRFSKTEDDKAVKKQKKLEYLSLSHFKDYLKSGTEAYTVDENLITSDGAFLCESAGTFIKKDDKGNSTEIRFFKNEVQQRVQIPADDEKQSRPYYIDRVFFSENCGLYFLARFENDTIREQVMTVLALLGESGIGTDRTVGNGLFYFKSDEDIKDIQLNVTEKSDTWLCLGLYLPTREEHQATDFDHSYWKLLRRGGYIAGSGHEAFRHLRKNQVNMFGEGSVLQSRVKLQGRYINLRPGWNDERLHPVWRCGRCLMINI